MKAILKKPGEKPEIIEIENDLNAFQEAVGGRVQEYPFAADASILCNEEGIARCLSYNTQIGKIHLRGPVLIVGVAGEDFADVPQPETTMELLWPTAEHKKSRPLHGPAGEETTKQSRKEVLRTQYITGAEKNAMSILEKALLAIEAQQPKERNAIWMVGEQLKDILHVEPHLAEIVEQDLGVKEMSLANCEKKIKEFADKHKTGNFACVIPSEAERIIREFYGLPVRGEKPKMKEYEPVNSGGIIDLSAFF